MANFLTNLFSAGAANLVEAVGTAIDKNTTTDEERKELDNEMAKAAMQHQVDMANVALEERKADYQELDSARVAQARIQESANASTLAKNVQPILALGIVILTFGMYFWILNVSPGDLQESGMKDIFLYILGALTTISTQVVAFYFGSSQGSKDKQRSIQQMTEQPKPQ